MTFTLSNYWNPNPWEFLTKIQENNFKPNHDFLWFEMCYRDANFDDQRAYRRNNNKLHNTRRTIENRNWQAWDDRNDPRDKIVERWPHFHIDKTLQKKTTHHSNSRKFSIMWTLYNSRYRNSKFIYFKEGRKWVINALMHLHDILRTIHPCDRCTLAKC